MPCNTNTQNALTRVNASSVCTTKRKDGETATTTARNPKKSTNLPKIGEIIAAIKYGIDIAAAAFCSAWNSVAQYTLPHPSLHISCSQCMSEGVNGLYLYN